MNTQRTNNLHFCYNSVRHVEEYAGPTSMFIAHKNRLDPAFQSARAKGAEVLAYFNPIEVPDVRVSALWEDFYWGDHAKVPLWPYLKPDGTQKRNWLGTKLTDIRVNSPWAGWVVTYIAGRMRDGQLDGAFLDVLGGQLWSAISSYKSWPSGEQVEWRAGAVDLMRRLDEARRQINSKFLLVNNNSWQAAPEAEQYVDGICIENHELTNAYIAAYASRSFGNLGHRRVLTVNKDKTTALGWAQVEGVTHVSCIGAQNYGEAQPPILKSNDLRLDQEKELLRAQLAQARAELAAAVSENTVLRVAVVDSDARREVLTDRMRRIQAVLGE